MAVFFQLFRVGSAGAQRFIDVDNAICAHLGVACDDVKYYHSWYDVIGFRLALGKTFEQIGEEAQSNINDPEKPSGHVEWWRGILRINHFLSENYTTDAWWGR